jgi:hypothetical protein
MFKAAINPLADAAKPLLKVLGLLSGTGNTNADTWKAWGSAVGKAAALVLPVAAAVKVWTAAQWLWNAAMTANPIGLIVIGIAGLAAAGYYLYQNWDTVCAAVSEVWNRVWEEIKEFWNWLTNIFSWGGVSEGFEAVKNIVSAGWASIKEWFGSGVDFAGNVWSGLTSGWESAENLISSGWDALKNSFAGEAVSGAWSWLKDLVGMDTADPMKVDEAALKAQLNDINVLNQMSKDFAARVSEMTAAWQPFKESLRQGFEAVFDTMARIGGNIRTVVIPAVKELNTALTIPLEDRSKGLPLWIAAGEELGIGRDSLAGKPPAAAPLSEPAYRGSSMDILAANAVQKAPPAAGSPDGMRRTPQEAGNPKVDVTIEPQEIKIVLDGKEIAKVVVAHIAHEEKRKGRGG